MPAGPKALAAAAACLVAALPLLGACPARRPVEPESPVLPVPPTVRPTLVRTWDELAPGLYAELRAGPPGMATALDEVAGHHDTSRWTQVRTRWGDSPVLEFRDTDHPHASRQATAGWFLGGEGVDGQQTVEGVVVRDFASAPTSTDPQRLVLRLGERWPLPWTLCQPRDPSRAGDIVAWDAARGMLLGLVAAAGQEGPSLWTVDRVEFVASGTQAQDWWRHRGYGTCDELGTLDLDGAFVPAGREE